MISILSAYLPGLGCLAMVLTACGTMLRRYPSGESHEATPAAQAQKLAEFREKVALRADLPRETSRRLPMAATAMQTPPRHFRAVSSL